MNHKLIYFLIMAILFIACGTPKPPESAFPQRIGKFEREKSAPSDIGKNGLNASYESPDGIPVAYTVLPFSSPEEARKELQNERQEAAEFSRKVDNPVETVENSDSKFILEGPRGSRVGLVKGSMVILISMPQKPTDSDFTEFVTNLPYDAYGVK